MVCLLITTNLMNWIRKIMIKNNPLGFITLEDLICKINYNIEIENFPATQHTLLSNIPTLDIQYIKDSVIIF